MLFTAFSLLLCFPALSLAASIQAHSSGPTVYLIRHGEKPSNGSTGLSPQGKERAQCLRGVFGASSSYHIGYIIAEQPQSNGNRDRPLETVTPLAKDLGLTVDTSCTKSDSDCVAKLVKKFDGSGNVLICWEHGELTDIVESLGVQKKDAPEYPNDKFNYIWTDPFPYSQVTKTTTSENCSGLDNGSPGLG